MRYIIPLFLLISFCNAQTPAQKMKLGSDSARWSRPYVTNGIKCTIVKDSISLASQSDPALDSVYKFLQRHPAVIIEVVCQTMHYKGSNEQEDDFKDKARNAIVGGLVKKGIAKERLYSGWGGDKKLKITDADVASGKTKKPAPFTYNFMFRILSADYIDPKAPKK